MGVIIEDKVSLMASGQRSGIFVEMERGLNLEPGASEEDQPHLTTIISKH